MRFRPFLSALCGVLFLAFGVVSSLSFGDCINCADCLQNLMDCATNGNNSCSSNCVKWSPQDCENFKSNALAEVAYIEASSQGLYAYSTFIVDTYGSMYSSISSLSNTLSSAIQLLDGIDSNNTANVSAVVDQLNALKSNLTSYQSAVSSVDSRGSTLVYTNITLNTSYVFYQTAGGSSVRSTISRKVDYANGIIDNCVTALQSIDYSAVSSVRSVLVGALSIIAPFEFDLFEAVNTAGLIGLKANETEQSSANLRSNVIPQIDCEPCGRGSGSSGSGGSSGETVDFSSLVAEVRYLRERLDYWMELLYNLIYNYYNDYNAIRVTAISGAPKQATLAGYANQANWFQRIEYLLFAFSGLSDEDETDVDVPDDINDLPGMTDVNSFTNAAAAQSERTFSTGANVVTQGFDRVSSSLTDFFSSFAQSFTSHTAGDSFDGVEIFSVPLPGSENSITLSVPDGTDSFLHFVSGAFKVLWCILFGGLYLLLVVKAFGLIRDSFKWLSKISVSMFG